MDSGRIDLLYLKKHKTKRRSKSLLNKPKEYRPLAFKISLVVQRRMKYYYGKFNVNSCEMGK